MINICVFEDSGVDALHPICTIRPCYDIFLGTDTLFDKINRYFGNVNITLHCRPELKDFVKKQHKGLIVNKINTGAACLFINGRVVLTEELYDFLAANVNQYDLLFTYKGHVVAAYLHEKCLKYMIDKLDGTPDSPTLIKYLRSKCVTKELDDVTMIGTLWDIINLNQDMIKMDFNFHEEPGIIKGDMHPFSAVYDEHNVYVGVGSEIEDFVVIDARTGPVHIAENVTIQSGSRIQGPAYIGEHSQILGARVKGSSIGAHCKIGGEVSNTIFAGYSNKAHDGYIGDSYVGKWVNMGAGSTTSNLKSTYGSISVEMNGEKVDTGCQFLGSIIGDHVKLSIGSRLDAGTIIETASILLGSLTHSKHIPAFTWGKADDYSKVDIDAFIKTATRMHGRRKLKLLLEEETLLRNIHQKASK